jgi:hypothetical protein
MLCGGRMLSLRALGNEKQSVHPSRAIKTLDLDLRKTWILASFAHARSCCESQSVIAS